MEITMMHINSVTVDTEDMGLAIALCTKGFILLGLEHHSGTKRVTFRFENTSGIQEATQAFWNGQLSVDAKNYWNESKSLKTRLYSVRWVMPVSEEYICKYIELFKKHFDIELSHDEACGQATKLLQLVKVVYRPITEKGYRATKKRPINKVKI